MKLFKKFVSVYLSNVESSLELLEKHSKETGRYQEVRKGYLGRDDSLYFSFHGTGCLFINNKLEIDFELPLYEEPFIPLDLYFMLRFWESSQDKFGYDNTDQIKVDYDKAKSDAQFRPHPFRQHQLMAPFPKTYNLFDY